MKNRIILTIIGIYTICNIYAQIGNERHAQVSGKFYGEKSDFVAMAKRPLLVELREEDPGIIKYLSKNPKTADRLKRYKASILDYNVMIKSGVDKYWKYNEQVEYKTKSEVDELRKAKSKKYVVLTYIELGDITPVTSEDIEKMRGRSDLKIPALRYTRIEQPDRLPDYKIYLPSSNIREDNKYLDCDFKFALIEMQAELKWMIDNNKKLQFNEYTEKVAEGNCSKLKDKTLQVEKSFLYKKLTEAEAKEAYGNNIEFVTAEELNSSFIDSKKGTAVFFDIPYGLANVNFGTAVVFFKVIVDCETYEILWAHNVRPMDINPLNLIMEKEFKNMGKCKM